MMILLLALTGVFIMWAISTYNRLISARNRVDEAFADIKALLKQRFDMIPNLVEIVKGYAKHEKSTLTEVIKLRNTAIDPHNPKEVEEIEDQLTSALKTIFALAENYPELKANQNFLELQKTLERLETKIQRSRRYYNAVVREYNNLTMMFPNNMIASIFNFTQKDYFDIHEKETEPVEVKF